MQKEIEEIKTSLKKIEKKGTRNTWLQFLFFPLIIGAIGFYFQGILKQPENRIEQLKVTQNIISNIYQDTIYQRAVVMKRILYEVLDNDKLANELGFLIEEHMRSKILTGTPNEVSEVVDALEKVSTQKDSLKEKLKSDQQVSQVIERTKRAKEKEREAFGYLVQGDLKQAERAFRKVDSIYPTYHQAYEISRYLKDNKEYFNDSSKIKSIQEYTVKNFPYGAPKDVIGRLNF
ncbi:hypothetical protein [Flagellimonas sp.]|uniref:hypothetical protein n=1 Tax=Flagellimonas sp. TaxID=2058762 RepID=UPI003B5CA546